MSQRLTDITLYYFGEHDIAKRFAMKQNVVSDLYVQYLNGYKPPKTSRISVQLGDIDDPGKHIGSILGPTAKFDKEQYWRLDESGQNKMILDTVHRIALLCAEHHAWDRTLFELAYRQVLVADFKYSLDGDRKMAKDRKHSAAVRIQKDEKCAIISAVFFDKTGSMFKVVELLRSFQDEMFYGGLSRRHKWFSNREFGLYSPNEEIVIKASINHDKSEIVISPKESDLERLEGYLRRATYVDLKSKEDFVKWMNR